jgi:ssRNA-specific RNase YbeY (16S rRNA maturation enzyme)
MIEADAESMEALEKEVLAKLGTPDPYLVREDGDDGEP